MEEMDKRKQIISFLQRNGPSLTIKIAKEIGLNTIFAGAFLSELSDGKTVKLSHMKVGSTPLYFLPGQEPLLERFADAIHGKEKEAFLLLKEQGILEDKTQAPAIRVALRALKDFAIPFETDNKLFWRYIAVTQIPKDFMKKLAPKLIPEPVSKSLPKPIPKKQITKQISRPQVTPEILKEKAEQEIEKQIITEEKANFKEGDAEANLGALSKEPKEEQTKGKLKPKETGGILGKGKVKSEFVNKIIESLEHNNMPIIEEISCKKKEYSAIIKVNSELGPITFLMQAKDKKKVSIIDLMSVIREAKTRDMLAFFLSPGELNKKSEEYALENDSILKIKRIRN